MNDAAPVERSTILVVDDEQPIRSTLRQRCEEDGHRVFEASTAREALMLLGEEPDVILLDCHLPDGHDLELLHRVQSAAPGVPVIVLTAFSSVARSVQAIKAGAFHYVGKPFDLEELMLTIAAALETRHLRQEVGRLRACQSAEYTPERLVGDSAALRGVKQLLFRVAQGPASTVLVTGESGTGKDLAAKIIHYTSGRAAKPFMNITCSALPETLLESELFGHERGAFTDAKQQKKGLLEQANGGTVFLDEIGEMSLGLQAKVLRFLEDKHVRRVGGTTDLSLDVRFIAATNRDLGTAVRARIFREDLFYRLNVMPIHMPSLRERPEDISRITASFIHRFNKEFGKHVRGLTPAASALLADYAWPGNVRELKNAVERAMLLTDGDLLGTGEFQLRTPTVVDAGFKLPRGGVNLQDVERDLLVQALDRTGGNQTRAAALLGLRRDQVRYRMEKFGLKERTSDLVSTADLDAEDGRASAVVG